MTFFLVTGELLHWSHQGDSVQVGRHVLVDLYWPWADLLLIFSEHAQWAWLLLWAASPAPLCSAAAAALHQNLNEPQKLLKPQTQIELGLKPDMERLVSFLKSSPNFFVTSLELWCTVLNSVFFYVSWTLPAWLHKCTQESDKEMMNLCDKNESLCFDHLPSPLFNTDLFFLHYGTHQAWKASDSKHFKEGDLVLNRGGLVDEKCGWTGCNFWWESQVPFWEMSSGLCNNGSSVS